jgi:hypothetical protein
MVGQCRCRGAFAFTGNGNCGGTLAVVVQDSCPAQQWPPAALTQLEELRKQNAALTERVQRLERMPPPPQLDVVAPNAGSGMP